MQYRAEIDGLRALAVIPVILFHAGFSAFSGGYVGVDVFFVISGYLITSIILSEMDDGNFSIINFYERRARRILPALFFVIAVCIPFAWAWFLPRDMKDFSESLVAVTVFSSNILFWLKSGYFETIAELKPLLHTWSLAVEEQYYILYPLFLLATWKFTRWKIVLLLIVISVLSLCASHWGAYNNPVATFYLLPTRGWEILFGSFISFYMHRYGEIHVSATFNDILSFSGIFLVIYSVLSFDEQTPFPSLFTLIPTLGAVLIILFTRENTIAYKVLSNRLMVGIGLVSYSAYLWHQPVIVFTKIRGGDPSIVVTIGLLLAVAFLSVLTWRYIEVPVRKKGFINRKIIFGAAISIAASFVLIGLAGHMEKGFPNRNPGLGMLDSLLDQNHGLSLECDNGKIIPNECIKGNNPSIAVWGDSYAMHLIPALESAVPREGIAQLTLSNCAPLIGNAKFRYGDNIATKISARDCIRFNKEAVEWIKEKNSIKLVVISSIFNFLSTDNGTRIYDGQREYEPSYSLVRDLLLKVVKDLKGFGKNVLLISPTPRSGSDLGRCAVSSIWYGLPSEKCNFSRSSFDIQTLEYQDFSDYLGNDIQKFSLVDLICPGKQCYVIRDGVPLYRDTGHLSIDGSKLIGKMPLFIQIVENGLKGD